MRLRVKIDGSEYYPLREGASISLRRPVSQAVLPIYDADGSLSVGTLKAAEVWINNRILWSADMTDAAWIKAAVTASAGTGVDPLWGAYTPTKIAENSATAQHFLFQGGLTNENNKPVVYSVYLKTAGVFLVRVLILQRDLTTTQFADVNLSNGAIYATGGSPTSTSSEDVGNGWYRITVIGNSGTGSNPCQAYVQFEEATSYLGDGSSGVLMFGAQWQEDQTSVEPFNLTCETSRIFNGLILAKKTRALGKPPGRLVTLECSDSNWRLDNPPAVVTKAYYGKTDQEIILDAMSESGLTSIISSSSSTVASLVSDIAIAFDGATMREVLEKLSQSSGAVYWVDQTPTLYSTAEGSVGMAGWKVRSAAPTVKDHEITAVAEFTERHSSPLNSVEVTGPILESGRRPRATATDATSISAHGTFHRKIEFREIATDAYAQEIADQLIASGKNPVEAMTFITTDASPGRPPITSVNQKLDIEAERLGVGDATTPTYQAFISREVQIRQLAGPVSEFRVTAGPFLPTLTDTMRKLEVSLRSRTSIPQAIGAIDFDAASSESVDSGTSIANIDDMADFSIFATVRCDSIASTRTIVAKEDGSNLGWALTITAAGLIQLIRTRASANYSYSRQFPGGFTAGNLYRIVATSDEALGARFWVNGVEATTAGASSVGSGAFDSEASSPLRVGRDNGGAYFDGAIGALAVWDLALPETTALGLHNLGFNALPFASRIQLAWALDEFGEGSSATGTDTIIDRSANGYHGSPQNTPVGDLLVWIAS